MSLKSFNCLVNDFEMWKPLLMEYLDRKKWGKHYKKIYINFKVVDCGTKPSFLWDIGTLPAVSTLKLLISQLKIYNLLHSYIFLICSENDIFIVNNISVNRVLTDKTFFKFMDISEESDLSVVSPHEDDCLMKVLQKEINELCSEKTENSYSAVFSKLCSPKVFGMILGYPVVYNVNNNNFSTFNLIPLVSVKVFIEYEGKPYEIYSFSYILIHNFTEHVDKWFNNLKLQFKMFNFKLSKENVTANVVL